ncbi:MAG: response regulator transcription factor [Ktedonobacterales bacterium]|nr:response regulator transcription factor [Ktedonobacterales bacterium]
MVATNTAVKHIYVIEDDVASATLIREALELEGDASWAVRVITDGTQALLAIESFAPDLVLLDLRMPGTNGSAIFRRLRERAETMAIPVIFISGATAYELHDSGIEDGVLLRKPVNLTILMHVVRRHLRLPA